MKPHVLILEDNFIILYDIAGLVTESLHAKPLLARSVAAALKLIPDNIAFAFLDIDVLDGVSYPVAQKLVKNHIPFIFLSAKHRNLLPEEFSEAPFLSKPVEGRNLMQLTKSLSNAFE
jgi:two-component SAPR family response regulator